MLDDPRVNFSLDAHGDGAPGSPHYGIQVESAEELSSKRERIDTAGLPRRDQNNLICGYRRQDKSWVSDPNGLQWETFLTAGVVEGAGYGCDALPGDTETD